MSANAMYLHNVKEIDLKDVVIEREGEENSYETRHIMIHMDENTLDIVCFTTNGEIGNLGVSLRG